MTACGWPPGACAVLMRQRPGIRLRLCWEQQGSPCCGALRTPLPPKPHACTRPNRRSRAPRRARHGWITLGGAVAGQSFKRNHVNHMPMASARPRPRQQPPMAQRAARSRHTLPPRCTQAQRELRAGVWPQLRVLGAAAHRGESSAARSSSDDSAAGPSLARHQTSVAPVASARRTHGPALASWQASWTTISSPGPMPPVRR